MTAKVIYRQLNKDHAYWTEKRAVGEQEGGHTAGLLSYVEEGVTRQNVLFDCGLGTLKALADFCDNSFWDQPLTVFITHGHADHHLELMILAEIYCQRRGVSIDDIRPPLHVYCTDETHPHLYNTHRWGYTDGGTLLHKPLPIGQSLTCGPFDILAMPVDHFPGAVIYVITFGAGRAKKIIVGWDMTHLPLSDTEKAILREPALALLEATTWTAMTAETGHTNVEDLVTTGFLQNLNLSFDPERERYGAYLVHNSGWEDPEGLRSEVQLRQDFEAAYPQFSETVRFAQRGQSWTFDLTSHT